MMNKFVVLLHTKVAGLDLDGRMFLCNSQEDIEETLKTYALPFDNENGIYNLEYAVYTLDATIAVEQSVELIWGPSTCI